jgi:integrase
MGEGLIEINPLVGTRKIDKAKERETVLVIEQLAMVWRACDYENDHIARIIRLLILTGARREEIVQMRRGEFEPGTGIWTLPEERSKNYRKLALPLPPIAHDLITGMHTRPGWSYVFSDKGQVNVAQGIARVFERCGFERKRFRLHDLRRSAATGMADIGVQPHIIECILNHRSGFRAGVAGTYNRATYAREMAIALVRWSEYLLAKVEGREVRDDDNVKYLAPPPLRTA